MGGLPKVDGQCEAELKHLVEQEPREIGRPFSVWTCLDLVKELAEKKLAEVCAETVRRHLCKLDYRVIRPVLSINSPDPDYETKALHLEQCQEQARQGEMILLYEDEVDLNLLPGGSPFCHRLFRITCVVLFRENGRSENRCCSCRLQVNF